MQIVSNLQSNISERRGCEYDGGGGDGAGVDGEKARGRGLERRKGCRGYQSSAKISTQRVTPYCFIKEANDMLMKCLPQSLMI